MASGTYIQPIGTLHEGWVEVDNVYTDDEAFLEDAEKLDDPVAIGAMGQEVFELGLTVRRLTQTNADVARIADQLSAFEVRVQSLTDKASLSLREQIDAVLDEDSGAIPKAARDGSETLERAITQALDTNDRQSAASRLVDEVRAQNSKAFGLALGEVRTLLDSSREDSPLAAMRRELLNGFTRPLQQMTDQLAAVHAVTVERGNRPTSTHEGMEYEALVGEILNEAATVSGDVVVATGAEPGIGTSKVGDFVVEVTNGVGRTARFVVEAKDTSLSNKKMLAELDAAAENRGAIAAILVTASPTYGWKKQPLQKVGPRRYVVVAERDDPSQLAFRVAYQMARADVVAELADDSTGTELDLNAVQARLDQARSDLDASSTIKRVLTSAEKEIARAKATLETMRASIADVLTQIEGELKPVE